MNISTRIQNKIKKTLKYFLNQVGYEINRINYLDFTKKASNFNEEQIISDLLSAHPPTHTYAIDIAATDGRFMSNTLRLFQKGWSGTCIETDGIFFSALASFYSRKKNVTLLNVFVAPDNVVDILKAIRVPKEIGLLSLDIDSFDYFILKEILTEYRPHLICAEVNTCIPPPYRFSVQYAPDYVWSGKDNFQGQSISLLSDLASEYGYGIVALEFNNAFLMPLTTLNTAFLTAEQAYESGYLQRNNRKEIFSQDMPFDSLHSLSTQEGEKFIKEMFREYEGKYFLASVPSSPK